MTIKMLINDAFEPKLKSWKMLASGTAKGKTIINKKTCN